MRTVVFVDAGFIKAETSRDDGLDPRVDARRFVNGVEGLVGPVDAFRWYEGAYGVDHYAYEGQQSYFGALARIPKVELVLGMLLSRPGGVFVQKGVDVRLALDMVALARDDVYDVAVLAAGDADFVPAAADVRALGKRVVVLARDGERVAAELVGTVDGFVEAGPEVVARPAYRHPIRRG